MNRLTKATLTLILLAVLFSLAGCGSGEKNADDPNLAYTQAAETMIAGGGGSAKPTKAPPEPTATQPPPEPTQPQVGLPAAGPEVEGENEWPEPTASAEPAAPAEEEDSGTGELAWGISGMAGELYGQSPNDYQTFMPGDYIDMMWRVHNAGTIEWTPDCYIQFLNGYNLGDGKDRVNFGQHVPANTQIDLHVPMRAPEASDDGYRSTWGLYTPDGRLFYEVYVIIEVVE